MHTADSTIDTKGGTPGSRDGEGRELDNVPCKSLAYSTRAMTFLLRLVVQSPIPSESRRRVSTRCDTGINALMKQRSAARGDGSATANEPAVYLGTFF